MAESVGTQAVRVLQRAEQALLELLAAAATAGDYDGIEAARSAASRVRQLSKSLENQPQAQERGTSGEADTPQRGRSRGTRAPRGYPKFRIVDSTLIKVGWSKKSKGEYTQRIPGESYSRVLEALAAVASEGRNSVASERVHEWLEEHGGGVPSYQTYAVLRFLRELEVIRQVGRGEYAIPADIAVAGASCWAEAKRG